VRNHPFWFDGMADFCSSNVGINDIQLSEENISMFPNPVSTGSVQFSNEFPIDVRVLDLRGRELFSKQQLPTKGSLSLEGLGSGLVLVEIRYEGTVQTERLIIQ
jgi:hypothetical protein